MQSFNENKNRRETGNQDCISYLSSDGKFYCYSYWDDTKKGNVTVSLEVGKDLSEDVTIVLKDMDHDQDLNDRYAKEHRDALFDSRANRNWADSNGEASIDPWNTVGSNSGNPEAVLFSEPEPKSDKVAVVSQIITEECTASQQELFYKHFGEGIQLEKIRQAEAARTGNLSSAQAFTNRKNKLLDKIAKALGVKRIKRRKSARMQ